MGKSDALRRVLIVGETIDGRLSAGSVTMGKQARHLAAVFEADAVGVLIGHDNEAVAQRWSAAAGIPVTLLTHPQCRYPNPAMTASGLVALAGEHAPVAVCFPHTMRGCQAAATLAWRLDAPCVTGVESVSQNNGRIVLSRPVFGGKLYETVVCDRSPAILTIMPGAFAREASAEAAPLAPAVEIRTLPDTDTGFLPEAVHRSADSKADLENAQVIVAGGRGLGEPEQTGLLADVAGMFKNAAVGGSRGACDQGWIPHSRQIGETGRTVAPALYLACGISGAPQHLAGMRGSRTIVSVNTDPKAAILHAAHYAVIENLSVFLPILRERYNQRNQEGEMA